MAVRMDIKEAGAWVSGLSKVMPDNAKKGLLAAAARLAAQLASDPSIPTDRGAARAGWRAEPTEDGADVFNLVNEMLFIDQGVRAENVKPGRLMIQALAEWAKRKGLNPDGADAPSLTGKKKPGVDAYQGIAWAIAMSMKAKGIFMPKRDVLANAVKTYGPGYVREEVTRAIKEGFFR